MLMGPGGRRRHKQKSIHYFVALPILWQSGVVFVSPTSLLRARNMIRPRHHRQRFGMKCHNNAAFRLERANCVYLYKSSIKSAPNAWVSLLDSLYRFTSRPISAFVVNLARPAFSETPRAASPLR